jgi:hypothetical protein
MVGTLPEFVVNVTTGGDFANKTSIVKMTMQVRGR